MIKKSKPVASVIIMILATMLAKLLGMLRSVLLASHYGTGDAAAAFSAASRIPLSFFDLLFSAAILGCFIPAYNSFGQDKKGASRFACSFLTLVLTATGILAFAGIVAAKPLISLIAPGLSAGTSALAVKLLRIMFPMVIFTGSTYTLVGVMQSNGSFILPAMISSVSNAGVILYFIFLDERLGKYGIFGLAAAYLVSWFLQLLTLAVPLLRKGYRFRFIFDLHDRHLKDALGMSLPVMLGSWLTPISLLAGTFFSTFASDNGNVVFEYAVNIFTMIAGILTYSICNYLFPSLSRLSASDNDGAFESASRAGIVSTAAVVLPFTAALYTLGGEIVSVLYMRNDFSPADAAATASVLAPISVAMPTFAAIEIFSRIFFAKSMPLVPMYAALAGAAANVTVSSILVFGFGMGISSVGAAYAAGLAAAALTLIIFSFLKIHGIYTREFFMSLIKLIICSTVFTALILTIHSLLSNIPYSSSIFKNIGVALISFIPPALIYLVLLKILRVRFR